MSGRIQAVFIVVIAFILCVGEDVSAETIAEFAPEPNEPGNWFINSISTRATAFHVVGNPTVTEIQLYLWRWSDETGYVAMQLRRDGDINGDEPTEPSPGYIIQIPKQLSEVSPDTSQWISFNFPGGGTPISPGWHWIVCVVNPDSNDVAMWITEIGNLYGPGNDSKRSNDSGDTWPIITVDDAYFKVFGTRALENTTTTITASPDEIAISGASTIDIEVRDTNSDLVSGPGVVSLSALEGTFAEPNVILSNGQASTIWTAPDTVNPYIITANYNGHSFDGKDFQASNHNTLIDVIAQNSATTTELILPATATTRDQIDISVEVRDGNDNPVTDGTVSFWSLRGEFSPDSVQDVNNGTASVKLTVPNISDTFLIEAKYSGADTGTIVYGASQDSNNLFVDYTDVYTGMTLRVSPDYPYKEKETFVIVKVIDNDGKLVPGGMAQFSAPSGWFDSNSIKLSGGMGYTKWHAPASTGPVNITANYPEHIAGGNRYAEVNDTISVSVIKDTDSTGDNLAWMTDWISGYSWPSDALPSAGKSARALSNRLSTLGWSGHEFSNSSAWEVDFKKASKGGKEDEYMDTHDFIYYYGHGTPGYITFITYKDGLVLHHISAKNVWGTKDADWMLFSSCKVLSRDSDWATTMNGIHLLCGFHTNATDSIFGKPLVDFLVKDSVYDEAHKIHQAWFLATDWTQSGGVRARVIGENMQMFDDHIWGQGYVSIDPFVDEFYWGEDHDDAVLWGPIADAGGPYNVIEGQVAQLDASGTLDFDTEDYLFYVWDLQPFVNTDSNDWDNNGSDDADDDADLWGRRPQHVFTILGNHSIRLIVIDDGWKTDTDMTQVNVAPDLGPEFLASPPIPLASNQLFESLEIIDNFPNLPSEVNLPIVPFFGTTLAYDEMINVGGNFGMEGTAGLDGQGNFNAVEDDNELIINQNTGSIMYLDRAKAYIYPGAIGPLPSEAQAKIIADNFLLTNGITMLGAVFEDITDIFYEISEKGARTRISRTPFQRRVNYRRTIDVAGQPYPVAGPGGKITVMLNDDNEVVLFLKIWRHGYADLNMYVPLVPPAQAIDDFHRLGPKALIRGSWIPPCKRIEIDKVTLGYYEDDFVTPQEVIFPVYILDLTCEDDKGSQHVQVYMSAGTPTLEAIISDPNTATVIDYNDTITFIGSAAGGMPPYTYKWESDVDGLLTTDPNDPNVTTSSLSVSYLTDSNSCVCVVLPHAISLTVTDSFGFNATEFVEVTVQGSCADFNRKDGVNFNDFARLAFAWLARLGDLNYYEKVDFDKNSTIGTNELCVLTGEWLQVP